MLQFPLSKDQETPNKATPGCLGDTVNANLASLQLGVQILAKIDLHR